MAKLTRNQFHLCPVSHGVYRVTYITRTGRVYKGRVTDMTLIDRVTMPKGFEPTQKALSALRWAVKTNPI